MLRSLTVIILVFCSASIGFAQPFPRDAKRIVFLGDSITHAGHFISLIEAQLLLVDGKSPELINLGLPSETCNGMSEPDHPFPRPNVHERLERALDKLNPDVVVACYGMNDGIYYPPTPKHFDAYKNGINKIITKVKASGAKLILMTPPAFDPLPLKKKGNLRPLGEAKYSWKTIYENYDDVIKEFADYVKSQSERVKMVVDLHGPVTSYVAAKRKGNPDFSMSPDGVHVNHEGHEVLAAAILKSWGMKDLIAVDDGLMTLITRRQQLMHSAWLSDVGHVRPGVKPGLPIEEAKKQSKDLKTQIDARAKAQRGRAKSNDTDHVFFPASKTKGELSLFVDYYLWIPPGVKTVRGIILHQHGCGPGASTGGITGTDDYHWRALATKWDCALMSSSYEARAGSECRLWCDPRNGSDQRFLQALDHFSKSTGHTEIKTAPWCLWGHSGGGFWASLMQTIHPERIAAVWLQSGQAFSRWESGEIAKPSISDAVYDVPVVACPGLKEKDHERFQVAWNGCVAMAKSYRANGAPFCFAPDPRTGHECGDSRYLAIPFFDECLSLRLPKEGHQLRKIDMDACWLGDYEAKKTMAFKKAKDASLQYWLPSQKFAKKWEEFIAKGSVSDATPPPSPRSAVFYPTKEEGKVGIEWELVADFESGVGGVRIERNGKTVVTLPEKPKSRFGRPLFQNMSYHDSPELPLPKSIWWDGNAPAGKATYKIYAINSVGLESEPATVVTN